MMSSFMLEPTSRTSHARVSLDVPWARLLPTSRGARKIVGSTPPVKYQTTPPRGGLWEQRRDNLLVGAINPDLTDQGTRCDKLKDCCTKRASALAMAACQGPWRRHQHSMQGALRQDVEAYQIHLHSRLPYYLIRTVELSGCKQSFLSEVLDYDSICPVCVFTSSPTASVLACLI